ncbi:MAG: glycosyltransferase family 87 protein [Isosphaeraceae bacterium]
MDESIGPDTHPTLPRLEIHTKVRWWEWGGFGVKRSLSEVRFHEVVAILLVGFTIWGYLDIRKRGRVDATRPELHRTDFTVFTGAGAAFFDGRDPYEARNPRGWYYLYPPLFALLVSPLAAFDDPTQVVIWYAISLLLALGCFFELMRLGRWLGREDQGVTHGAARHEFWIGVGCAIAVALPALECLQRGQLGIALLYPTLLGSRLVLENRSNRHAILGGIILALPVAIKLVPALPLICLLGMCWLRAILRRRVHDVRRSLSLSLGVGVGAGLFVLVVPSAILGISANLRHLENWYHRVVANRDVGQQHGFHIDSVSNQSLSNATYLYSAQVRGTAVDRSQYRHWLLADTEIARRRASDDAARLASQILRVTLGLLLLALIYKAARDGGRDTEALVPALGSLGIVVLSPLAWTHYYVLWLPAILIVPGWLIRQGHPRAAAASMVVPILLTWVHYVGPAAWNRWGLLGLGSSGWFLAIVVASLVLNTRTTTPFPEGWRVDEGSSQIPPGRSGSQSATVVPSPAER